MPQKYRRHSFRGLLADGAQDEINLERQNANLAYRITKFELIPNAPGTALQESVVKIYREEQSSVDGVIDFTDTNLLAAGYIAYFASQHAAVQEVVTFDNILFSRNIYVTHFDVEAALACNYYIEIEEVPVAASTLMQIKLGTARRNIGGKMGG